MRITMLVSASVVAIALAATIGSVSAADQFATLDGVTAVAMSSGELDAVTGLHVHFVPNPGHDTVRIGQPPVGHRFHCEGAQDCSAVGYNGLLKAELNGAINIPGTAETCVPPKCIPLP